MSDGEVQGSRKSTSPRYDAEQQAYDALINALSQWTAAAKAAVDEVHKTLDELRGFNSTRARVACAAVYLILEAYHEFSRERNMIANIAGTALNPPTTTSPRSLFQLY